MFVSILLTFVFVFQEGEGVGHAVVFRSCDSNMDAAKYCGRFAETEKEM